MTGGLIFLLAGCAMLAFALYALSCKPRPLSGNDEQRLECRPLDRDPAIDDLFFCGLGTLWCTEAHGDLAWQGGDQWWSREVGADDDGEAP